APWLVEGEQARSGRSPRHHRHSSRTTDRDHMAGRTRAPSPEGRKNDRAENGEPHCKSPSAFENTARVRASAFSSSEPRTGTCRRKYHDTSFQPLASDQDRRATSRGRRTAHGDAEVMAGRIRSRRMSVHSYG